MPSYVMPDLTPKVVTINTPPPKPPGGGLVHVLNASQQPLRVFAEGSEAVAYAATLGAPVILAVAPVIPDFTYVRHGLPAPRDEGYYVTGQKIPPRGSRVDPIAWNTTPQLYPVQVRAGVCVITNPAQPADAEYEGPPGLEPGTRLPSGCVLKRVFNSGIYTAIGLNGKFSGVPELSP